MSVQRVTLGPSDENYAPPTKEIDISVIGPDVFITVYDGSVDDLVTGRKREYEVPAIAYHELLAALNAFSDVVQGIRYARPQAAHQLPEKKP